MNSKVLTQLGRKKTDIVVTMYLPVLAGPENSPINISVLHHMMSDLKKMLNDTEIPKNNHQQIVNKVADLEQYLGRPSKAKSIAVFVDKDCTVSAYKVPHFIEAAIYVMAPSLQLAPLVAKYNDHLRYWVLNLSQKGCQLFRVDDEEISEIANKELAKDLVTALRLDITEDSVQQSHSVSSPGGSGTNESFNGQGGYKDHRKKYLEDYLRFVDKQITNHIAKPSEPLVLIGVDYIQTMYKKVSLRKNLLASRHALDHNTATSTNIKALVRPMLPQLPHTHS